jgi:hypothetical protein
VARERLPALVTRPPCLPRRSGVPLVGRKAISHKAGPYAKLSRPPCCGVAPTVFLRPQLSENAFSEVGAVPLREGPFGAKMGGYYDPPLVIHDP